MEPNLNPRVPRSKLVLIKALGRSMKASEADARSDGPSASNDVISAPAQVKGHRSVRPDPFRQCKDGERTEHLTSLLGRWYHEGKTEDEAALLALAWNARNVPPLLEDKVLRTAASMFQTHKRNHPPAANEPAIVEPLFDLEAARVDRFLDYDPPPRKWLLNDCLPLGKVGLLVAPGGTGKSQLALQLAIAVATGEPLAGYWDVDEQGPVLALFAEEDDEELHRRVWSILRAGASKPDQELVKLKLRSNLFIKSMTGESCRMTMADLSGSVHRTEFAERAIAMLKALPDIKLVILDPVSRFRGGNENAAEDATAFVEAAELIAKTTSVTVLLLHHANKSSTKDAEQNQNASRGSSALTDGVRFQMNLALLTEDQAEELKLQAGTKHLYVAAKVTKNNYAPTGDTVYLKRGDHGVLQFCDIEESLQTNRYEQMCIVVGLVRDGVSLGKAYSKTHFAKVFGGRKGLLRMGINKVEALIDGTIEEGYLKQTDDHQRHLVLTDKPIGMTKNKVVIPDMHMGAHDSPHGSEKTVKS